MLNFSRDAGGTPTEKITGGVPSIDVNHAQIHAKRGFSLAGTITVATTKVGAIQIDVPTDVAATVTVDMTNANADLTYTAVDTGYGGNSITVTHVDPSGNDADLAVSVSGKAVTVSLATSGAGAITSTATEVAAAIAASAAASALVTCEAEGTGAGVVNAETAATLTGGSAKAYVHFQALSVTVNGGPASISLLENYTMDETAAAAASALTPINHHRISPVASVLPVTAYIDVTATTVEGATQVTLASLSLPDASTGANQVNANSGAPEEFILNPGSSYLAAFSNADTGNVVFGYNFFWYEENAG
jgi:hypothetical protein